MIIGRSQYYPYFTEIMFYDVELFNLFPFLLKQKSVKFYTISRWVLSQYLFLTSSIHLIIPQENRLCLSSCLALMLISLALLLFDLVLLLLWNIRLSTFSSESQGHRKLTRSLKFKTSTKFSVLSLNFAKPNFLKSSNFWDAMSYLAPFQHNLNIINDSIVVLKNSLKNSLIILKALSLVDKSTLLKDKVFIT